MHTQSHKTISSPRGKGYRSKRPLLTTHNMPILLPGGVLSRCVRVQASHPLAGESVRAIGRRLKNYYCYYYLLLLLPTTTYFIFRTPHAPEIEKKHAVRRNVRPSKRKTDEQIARLD